MDATLEVLKSIDDKLSTKIDNSSISFIISWISQYDSVKATAVNRQVFTSPIVLDSLDYEVAPISLETFYSFPNIEDGVNNVFAYKTDPTQPTQLIYIPTGNYEINNIENEIRRQVGDSVYNNMVLTRNVATSKAVFVIKNNYRIDFTVPNSIREVLGFESRLVGGADGYYNGDEIINILSVNSVFVNCDLINNSYSNGVIAPIIYSFFPNVSPGFKIVRNVEHPIYLRINKSQINSVTTWLTDQDNKELNFRGETITIRFHMRRIR
jgi:hypothetical protein